MEQQLTENTVWFKAAKVGDFPKDGGTCVKYKDMEIAVFNFTRRGEWYATQNLCPHKKQMVLARGMIGAKGDIPKVACPFHKKTFSLCDGHNMDGEDYEIATYPIKVEDGSVYIQVPE